MGFGSHYCISLSWKGNSEAFFPPRCIDSRSNIYLGIDYKLFIGHNLFIHKSLSHWFFETTCLCKCVCVNVWLLGALICVCRYKDYTKQQISLMLTLDTFISRQTYRHTHKHFGLLCGLVWLFIWFIWCTGEKGEKKDSGVGSKRVCMEEREVNCGCSDRWSIEGKREGSGRKWK